jgi:hypothetical protein
VLEHVTVTRYVTSLREGGSLPAIMEAGNLGTQWTKRRPGGRTGAPFRRPGALSCCAAPSVPWLRPMISALVPRLRRRVAFMVEQLFA